MSDSRSVDHAESSSQQQAWWRVLLLVLLGIVIGVAINQRAALRQLDRETILSKMRNARDVVEPKMKRPGERIQTTVDAAIGESATDVGSAHRGS